MIPVISVVIALGLVLMVYAYRFYRRPVAAIIFGTGFALVSSGVMAGVALWMVP